MIKKNVTDDACCMVVWFHNRVVLEVQSFIAGASLKMIDCMGWKRLPWSVFALICDTNLRWLVKESAVFRTEKERLQHLLRSSFSHSYILRQLENFSRSPKCLLVAFSLQIAVTFSCSSPKRSARLYFVERPFLCLGPWQRGTCKMEAIGWNSILSFIITCKCRQLPLVFPAALCALFEGLESCCSCLVTRMASVA